MAGRAVSINIYIIPAVMAATHGALLPLRVPNTFLPVLTREQIVTAVTVTALTAPRFRRSPLYCTPLSRLFGGSRCCARCQREINCTDLVMKARHCVFHVDCFKCATCNSKLEKGERLLLLFSWATQETSWTIFVAGGGAGGAARRGEIL